MESYAESLAPAIAALDTIPPSYFEAVEAASKAMQRVSDAINPDLRSLPNHFNNFAKQQMTESVQTATEGASDTQQKTEKDINSFDIFNSYPIEENREKTFNNSPQETTIFSKDHQTVKKVLHYFYVSLLAICTLPDLVSGFEIIRNIISSLIHMAFR